jgi:MinD superfamily P-loop ATPase
MIEQARVRIAVASGKGGTGKTLVATNLFYLLQGQGHKVTLVDCDAEEPNGRVFFSGTRAEVSAVIQKVPVIDENKCTYCGRCHEYCNYNAIFILPPARIIRVIEDLCHGCGACSVACRDEAVSEKDVPLGTVSRFALTSGSSLVEARMKVGVFSPVPVIKAAVQEAGSGGIVIMDAPPGTSCPFIHTVSTADYVVLVTEPTPFGLSDLKQSVETLKTMNKACGVIINRAGLGDSEVYDYLAGENIPVLMEIPFDKSIASSYSRGELAIKSHREWESMFMTFFNEILKSSENTSCN